MDTILGAGGVVANELVPLLIAKKQPVRVVGRNAKSSAGAQAITADVTDLEQTIAAVAGSKTVYLLVGLKYDRKIWRELWPKIMDNTIEAAKRAGAKLIFFDNVYMYGPVKGAMTEQTPFNPRSVKGEIRAQLAQKLLDEIKAGKLSAIIARSADFYGPNAKTGIPNALVFDNFARGAKGSWLCNVKVPHSFTFVPDAAKAMVMLANSSDAWNQTWHLPTRSSPPTAKQLIESAARALGVKPRYHVLHRPIIRLAGLFNTTIRELPEMLYQYDRPYLFDSSKFEKAFKFTPTEYDTGIGVSAAASRRKS